jgi:hypothetical protein
MPGGNLGAWFLIPERVGGLGGECSRIVTSTQDLERRAQDFDGILAAQRLYPGIPLGGDSEGYARSFLECRTAL